MPSNVSLFGNRIFALSKDHIVVFVLFAINLLNYMDRYTIAAVLTDVQSYFKIDDKQVGLLQTVFICAYMIFAPVCGYLGDRYSRKLIMIIGIFIWSTTVLLSSFMPQNGFWMFFILRGIVGIGEASYSTIAPVIIADLFISGKRTKMLTLFFFAIPIGSGLGYVVGANIALVFGGWQWGIRLTPLFGALCIVLLIFVVHEPVRGGSEKCVHVKTSSWSADIHYLFSNRSFVLSSFGFVCIAFVSGSVSWWMPTFVVYSEQKRGLIPSKSRINVIFGIITCIGGFIGVSAGSLLTVNWQKTNKKAGCFICAIGLLLCTPFYFGAINLFDIWPNFAWVLTFCAITCLCLNWAILSDLLLHVVIPSRRATANAIQILLGHLLGDASSPYIVGLVSDAILSDNITPARHFYSLKYALLIPPFFLVLGGFFFLWCSLFVEKDRQQVESILGDAVHSIDGLEESEPLLVGSNEPNVLT